MTVAALGSLVLVASLLLGLLVGSFLNVCIYRLPRESQSIVWPPSHCPTCGTSLRPWENVPLLSYSILGGRCRSCSSRIGLRYPVVEGVTGLVYLGLAGLLIEGRFRYAGIPFPGDHPAHWGVPLLLSFALFAALFVAAMVDLRHRIIPDEVTILAVPPAIVLSGIFPEIHRDLPLEVFSNPHLAALLTSLTGAVVGVGMLQAVATVGRRLWKKEVMGFGDVKFMGFLGAVLGGKAVMLTFFLAAFLGAVCGLGVLLFTGDRRIPFGPYLALAGFISFLGAERIFDLLVEFMMLS